MATVQRPKPEPTYHEGRPNQVIDITEVKTYMIKFTDAQGKEEMAQVQVFGKDPEDGGTGVWVVANEEELMKQLRGANKHVRRGVRARIKALTGDLSEDDAPADLGNIGLAPDDDDDESEDGVGSLNTNSL